MCVNVLIRTKEAEPEKMKKKRVNEAIDALGRFVLSPQRPVCLSRVADR